jgi:hypothetical protein
MPATDQSYIRKPAIVSTRFAFFGAITDIDKEHHNSVDRHKDRHCVYPIPELGLRKNAVVKREDAGFDEKQ